MSELVSDPGRSFTVEVASRALTLACQRVGINSSGAELIRLGSNGVFRIGDNGIVRVAPPMARSSTRATILENAKKQIAVSRWLMSVGYSVTRAMDVVQPVEAEDCAVTFWESVGPETVFAPIEQVAELIRRLHDLDWPPATVDLPELLPFGGAGEPVPEFDGLTTSDAAFMRERYLWAREKFGRLEYPLGRGPIHGDANVGNVLVDSRGEAVLIDLDSFSIGPREWDLIQTALFADRLGWHTAEEYRIFVEVYGYDITQWEGYETLADMREIAMTAWLSNQARTSSGAASEAAKRIEAIRSGGSRRDWGAY